MKKMVEQTTRPLVCSKTTELFKERKRGIPCEVARISYIHVLELVRLLRCVYSAICTIRSFVQICRQE